ncbi:MAG TPA: restriction endonuclease fold toxin-2 domain-containing protein [Pseudonocardiaceae bacterium]
MAGFVADRDVMFQASVQFLDAKTFVLNIAAGTAGDLASSVGMAGDDDAAHNFANIYEPCARSVVQAMDKAGQAMAAISGRLLTMAWNYLKTEDNIAASFNGGQIDTSSGMSRPPECEPTEAHAGLPSVIGPGQTNDIPVISQFWPQGYPDRLRAAADVWRKAGELIDDAQVNAANQALPVFVLCEGAAVEAFGSYAATVFTGHPSDGSTIAAGQPLMENVSAGCRVLANACDSFAGAIDTLRNKITDMAIGAGLIAVGGLLLSIVTVGGSDAAASAADAGVVADASAAAAEFATAETTGAAAGALADAEAIIEAAAAQLNVDVAGAGAGPALPGVLAPSGFAGHQPSDFRTNVPAPVGPIPPNDPPAFPLYSPGQETAAAAWMGALATRGPNYGTPDDRAYQLRIAGPTEYQMTGADGSTVWADGFRPADGAIIDAKNVREQGCSPRTLQGLQQQDFGSQVLSARDDRELTRYQSAIDNPAGHAQFLEIDTNDPETTGYWQFLCAENHVKSDVRYTP